MTKVRPEEVFTPRSSEVNRTMYVRRPGLEKQLERAVRGSKHILIHGESGSGKSWLYKQHFGEHEVTYVVANLANASRLGSVTKEIENVVAQEQPEVKSGFTESKKAKVSAVLVDGELEHETSVTVRGRDPFEECLALVRRRAGGKAAVLVLDNLEAIFGSSERMNELADLVILLDDQRYAVFNVKLLVVGIPGDVREYFNRTPNRESVANRLQELSEVARLPEEAAGTLVERGFRDVLRYRFEEAGLIETLKTHAAWVTDRIPQRLHEYCLEVAHLAESSQEMVRRRHLEDADWRWLQESLTNAYSRIEKAMNVKETKIGRRNQTLFALGHLRVSDFRANDVEDLVRSEFPTSTRGKTLNIGGLLAELADPMYGILKRSPKGDGYMFSDPKYRMCIRVMLAKEGEEVQKVQHSG